MKAFSGGAGLVLAGALLLILGVPAHADGSEQLEVSPDVVGVSTNFGGAEVVVSGAVPADTELIVKVLGRPQTVKLSKKGTVMGIFWMTTEQATVENMPGYYVLYSTQPVASLLSLEDQIDIGVDAECVGIMRRATVVGGAGSSSELTAEKAGDYLAGLRNMYIKDGEYMPCVSCHKMAASTSAANSLVENPPQMLVQVSGERWIVRVNLPADAPLGDYDVTAYYVRANTVVGSESTHFKVEKTGLVNTLDTMARQNAPLYGAMSLLIVVSVGLLIGVIFPKARH